MTSNRTCEHGIPVEIACGYCILFASSKVLKAELEQAKYDLDTKQIHIDELHKMVDYFRSLSDRYRDALGECTVSHDPLTRARAKEPLT